MVMFSSAGGVLYVCCVNARSCELRPTVLLPEYVTFDEVGVTTDNWSTLTVVPALDALIVNPGLASMTCPLLCPSMTASF